MGKGSALKTAFRYVLENYNDVIGVITADSDGQHTPECINMVKMTLKTYNEMLILGVRKFDTNDIPWKSKFGNLLTEKIFRFAFGKNISDTQTGLRGIPRKLMIDCLQIKSNRFEFEMEMLIHSVKNYEIKEIPIETIYDSAQNHQTHFKPIIDSIKIYKILFKQLFKYTLSSFFSFLVDILLYTFLCYILKGYTPLWYVFISSILARLVSSIFNFYCNHNYVFQSNKLLRNTSVKYFCLSFCQMFLSAVLTTIIVYQFINTHENIAKILVDFTLFFVSYCIQNRYIFK